MKKIQIKNLKKHLPLICTVVSAGGVVLTAIQAVKDYKRGLMKVNSIENLYSLTMDEYEKEKRKIMLQSYIPTFMIGGATIALMFVSNTLGKKQYLALASAATMATTNYHNYRNEVINRYGEPVDVDILKTIAAEKAETMHISGDVCGVTNACLELDDIHEQELTFYDSYGQRFFKSTIGKVLQAEYHINRNFCIGATPSLNDFYEFLGIEKTEYGDTVGWGCNLWEDGICWIEFNHIKADDTENGVSYYIIDFPFAPAPDFEGYE